MLYDAFGNATVDDVVPSDLLLFVYQVSDGLVVEVFSGMYFGSCAHWRMPD